MAWTYLCSIGRNYFYQEVVSISVGMENKYRETLFQHLHCVCKHFELPLNFHEAAHNICTEHHLQLYLIENTLHDKDPDNVGKQSCKMNSHYLSLIFSCTRDINIDWKSVSTLPWKRKKCPVIGICTSSLEVLKYVCRIILETQSSFQ